MKEAIVLFAITFVVMLFGVLTFKSRCETEAVDIIVSAYLFNYGETSSVNKRQQLQKVLIELRKLAKEKACLYRSNGNLYGCNWCYKDTYNRLLTYYSKEKN